MSNEQGILQLRIDLYLAGEIGSTGNKIMYGGTEIPEPEELHSRSRWKKEGRKVKDGVEGYQFRMWMKRKNEEQFYHKNIYLFSESQTEEIPESLKGGDPP